jgi:hypothetical protein
MKLGMVANACNPALERLKQEDLEFQVSLGYTANSRLTYIGPISNKKEKKKIQTRSPH